MQEIEDTELIVSPTSSASLYWSAKTPGVDRYPGGELVHDHLFVQSIWLACITTTLYIYRDFPYLQPRDAPRGMSMPSRKTWVWTKYLYSYINNNRFFNLFLYLQIFFKSVNLCIIYCPYTQFYRTSNIIGVGILFSKNMLNKLIDSMHLNIKKEGFLNWKNRNFLQFVWF